MSELTFARMPKTGGIWLREFVNPNFYFDKTEQYNYGVYRDPVDWYKSWLSFSHSGSEIMQNVYDPIASIIEGPITIEKYMNTILFPEKEMKDIHIEEADATFMFGEKTIQTVIDDWVDSGLDFYSHLVTERLTNVKHVVDFNGIQENIFNLAVLHNEHDLAEKILMSKPVNITNRKVKLSNKIINDIKIKTKDINVIYLNRIKESHYEI